MNGSQARAPIVLVHGILGFNQLNLAGMKIADYFRDIPQTLRDDGHVVPDPPQLNRAGSIVERAQNLKDYLRNNVETAGKKVHLIAHSMGGLDSRFMISKLGMADQVLSLTTIGTPHHGSPLADISVKGTNPLLNKALEKLGIDIKGANDLTTGKCRQFNLDVPDEPGIRYFSIAGRFTPRLLLDGPWGITHDIVSKTEKDNDGLVSVQSATLAERSESWTDLGLWETNHFRMINWGTNIALSHDEVKDKSVLEKYRALGNHVSGITA